MKSDIIMDLRGMFGEPFAVEAFANPNRHGLLGLIAHHDGTFSIYEQHSDGDEPWMSEHLEYRAARDAFDRERGVLAETPNWDAQAAYDTEHGTDNGYDPQVLAWNEAMDNEY